MLWYHLTLKSDSIRQKKILKHTRQIHKKKLTEIKYSLVFIIFSSSFIKQTLKQGHFLAFDLSTLPKVQKHKRTSM